MAVRQWLPLGSRRSLSDIRQNTDSTLGSVTQRGFAGQAIVRGCVKVRARGKDHDDWTQP